MAIIAEYKGQQRYIGFKRDGSIFINVPQNGKDVQVIIGTVTKTAKFYFATSEQFPHIFAMSSHRDHAVREMLNRMERERRAQAEEAAPKQEPQGFQFQDPTTGWTGKEHIEYVNEIAAHFNLPELRQSIEDGEIEDLTVHELTALQHANRYGTSYDLMRDRLLTEIIRLREVK